MLSIPIDWAKDDGIRIDPSCAVTWTHRHEYQLTLESYAFLDRLERHQARASGLKLSVNGPRWVELSLDSKIELAADALRDAVEALRKIQTEGHVAVVATAIHFDRGQHLLDWAADVRTELRATEIRQ